MDSDLPYLKNILEKRDIQLILQDKKLAQLGDFLINFLYSTAILGIQGSSKGVHVWDVSLRQAMDTTNLRSVLGRRTKPDKVADAAEALIAYAYYSKLFTIDEMLKILNDAITGLDDNSNLVKQKETCHKSITGLLEFIVMRAIGEGKLDEFTRS